MDQVTLSARRRTEAGSRPAKRLRRDGLVPAVVYGSALDTLHVAVDSRELYSALHTEAGVNAVFNVEVEGGDTVLAVAREVQRHPVRGDITHLDFIQVRLDQAIEADVGIEFTGEPEAVREGAILETISNTVTVSALPTEIPSSISVDVAHLALHDTLTVADLPEIEGVRYLDDASAPLITVLLPRLEEPEPEPELVDELLLEGEEPADAEDEAAAAETAEEGEEG